MKISVVIPARDEERNIANAIKAVLAQDHPDFEVIVVNSASLDKTAEVAGRFPVKIVHDPQGGLIRAREAGRRAASGDLIANMDADCLPEPDWLSRAVVHFSSPDIVAVTGPYDYYDGAKAFRVGSLFTQRHVYRAMGAVLQSPFIKGGAVLIGGNNLIRADVLRKTGGYNTDLDFYGEDTDTAKRVSKHGRVHFNPKLAMKTSARRFKAEGTVHLMLKYWYYFFKHTFFVHKKKPKVSKSANKKTA